MANNRTVVNLVILALWWTVLAVAKTDVETGAECIDSDPLNCPYWASIGECKANRGYMHKHCRKSCDRCHVMRVKDRSEISNLIAQRRKEMEEMQKERRKEKEALKVLEGDGEATVATTATATISSTGEIETNTWSSTSAQNSNAGSREKDASRSSKPNSAAATTSSSTIATTTTTPKKKKTKIDAQTGLECVDLDENCPFMAATGKCLENRSYMSVNCRLSCDRCHVVRVQNPDEIRKFMERKNKEHEKLREERKQTREINKILQGEM